VPKAKLDPFKEKMKQVLDQAEFYLENSLVVLERERKVVVNFEGEEKGFTEQVNEYFMTNVENYTTILLITRRVFTKSYAMWAYARENGPKQQITPRNTNNSRRIIRCRKKMTFIREFTITF
jgi:hypothetical protein